MTEREIQHDPQVLEGEDELPRQADQLAQDQHPQERMLIAQRSLKVPPLDPYTPEPGPRAGDRRAFRAMRLSWIPIAILIAIVIYAALR